MDTTTGVALTQLILVLPFCMWMLKGYFNTVPKDLDQSAEVDGANLFQRLVHIILPVASPGIAVGLYSFVVSWSDYLIVSVVSQSQRTATVTLTISRLTASLLSLGPGMRCSDLDYSPDAHSLCVRAEEAGRGLTAERSRSRRSSPKLLQRDAYPRLSRSDLKSVSCRLTI